MLHRNLILTFVLNDIATLVSVFEYPAAKNADILAAFDDPSVQVYYHLCSCGFLLVQYILSMGGTPDK